MRRIPLTIFIVRSQKSDAFSGGDQSGLQHSRSVTTTGSLGGIYSNAIASGKKYRIGHFNYIHGGRNYCFLQSMLTVGKTSPIDVVLNSNGTVYSINN